MSTARLNVWVTEIGHSCHIDSTHDWFVHIVDCDGKVLTWCGREYSFIHAKCGHAEIEIPPGCYSVFASWTPKKAVHPPYTPFGNQLTHIQVVRANCGDHVCVTLFSPSLHFCGTWFGIAVRNNLPGLEAYGVDGQLARTAVDAIQKLVDKLPADPFSANLKAFEKEGQPDR